MNTQEKTLMKREMIDTLNNNILNFWSEKMIDPAGGFYGRMDGLGNLDPSAPRGLVLNSRILWSYAAAYGLTKNHDYLEKACWARNYLIDKFFDVAYGGMFCSINPDGSIANDKVQLYSQGFAIYGFSELARVYGDSLSYNMAIRLFFDIERHGHDDIYGGYIEALKRDWSPISDKRLSKKDLNAPKSMNTHLHLLEPYANLLRIWPNPALKARVRELIEIFLDKIIDPATGHLGLFFDSDWTRIDNAVSYGHDIEASWLLMEAAEILGDEDIIEPTRKASRRLALAALEGLNPDGSLSYELHPGSGRDDDRHWWVQAENVVGLLWLAKYHDMPEMYDKAKEAWEYIKSNLIDPEGEWYWSCRADGSINFDEDKAGFWKCPYHNSRMCIEVVKLLSEPGSEPAEV